MTCISLSGRGSETVSAKTKRLKEILDALCPRIFACVDSALIVPRQIAPSAVVMTNAGLTEDSPTRPYEIFPDMDLLSHTEILKANSEHLKRTGLDGVFSPDDSKVIRPIQIIIGNEPVAVLLLKTDKTDRQITESDLGDNQKEQLRSLVLDAQKTVTSYESEIVKETIKHSSPSVVYDQSSKVVFANRSFCEVVTKDLKRVVGSNLEDLVRIQEEDKSFITFSPLPEKLTADILIVPTSLSVKADLELSYIATICGPRNICAIESMNQWAEASLSDLSLLATFSRYALSNRAPNLVLRKLLQTLADYFRCRMISIMRRHGENQFIVTPYSTLSIHSLGVTLLNLDNEPLLSAFLRNHTPVFCEDISHACPSDSFFKKVISASGFAFIPVETDGQPEHAMIMMWNNPNPKISVKKLNLLKTLANLAGCLLHKAMLLSELRNERDTLRRFTRLVAGRELKMAELKRENARLRQMLMNLETAREK